MAECPNHAGADASIACARCARSFCDSCTVRLFDATYCGACKAVVARGMLAPPPTSAAADEAFKVALAGIFCFGMILGPFAVVKAIQGLREVERDPRIGGRGKAIAALVIGSVVSVGWIGYFALILLGVIR